MVVVAAVVTTTLSLSVVVDKGLRIPSSDWGIWIFASHSLNNRVQIFLFFGQSSTASVQI